MAFSAPGAYLTHQQKVLRLYKRALRHLESFCIHRWETGDGGPRARGVGSGEAYGGRESPGNRTSQGLRGRSGKAAPRPAGPGSRPHIVAPGLRDLEELPLWPGPQFSVKDAAFSREGCRRFGEIKESAPNCSCRASSAR